MEFKERDITFPVGDPFVFFVYLGKELRFIGYTEDLNKKSFSFQFEYDRITGYFYPFRQVIRDYIDELILERKPAFCKPRYGLKESNLRKFIKESIGIVFSKKAIEDIKEEYLSNDDYYTFGGERYIKEFSKETMLMSLTERIKNSQE